MATRSRSVLALVCLIALAACQAGGTGMSGSNAVPSVGSPLSSSVSSSSQTQPILKAAPHGVRTYVHLPLRNSAELDRLIQEQSTKNSPMFHRFLTGSIPSVVRAECGRPANGRRSASSRRIQNDDNVPRRHCRRFAAVVERTFHVQLRMRPKSRGCSALRRL